MVLLTMSVPVGIFIAASMSALATATLIVGVLGFAVYKMFCGWGTRQVLVLCMGISISVFSYFSIVANTGAFADKYRKVSVDGLESPRNVAQRIVYWKFYAVEVFGNAKSAVFGHVAPPDRTQYPSAHNYYLDFAYNFGLAALLPLLGLVTVTLVIVYRNWAAIAVSPSLLGLTSVVLFLILVDNSLKVGMRQPYPGILTFFLWGVLLTRLDMRSVDLDSPNPA
jgi:O-antigen ligase